MPDPRRPESSGPARHRESFFFNESAFEQKRIWTGIYEILCDLIFTSGLPPLQLTSTPLSTRARSEARMNPWAFGTAALVNGGLMAVLILFGFRGEIYSDPAPGPKPNADPSRIEILSHLAALSPRSGGGAGSHDLTPPTSGRPPKFEPIQIVSPVTPLLANPQLPVDAAIATPLEIRLADDSNMPKVGVRNATTVTLDSFGTNGKHGIGTGSDGLYGSGKGPSIGQGGDSGIYVPGGDVSAPVPVVSPEAEFSDEARRQKFQGICMISVIVDAQGNPQNPRVVQPLGMGLDEKAIEAVLKYKFKPARKNGKPVPVRILVEVNFRLY